jgi:hypothetical protein
MENTGVHISDLHKFYQSNLPTIKVVHIIPQIGIYGDEKKILALIVYSDSLEV